MRKPGSASDPLWYKDAILYELHVRSFADSNGDGIGDFPGLTSKLPYLESLGVTCLWLLPFFPSPLRDDGYDIADYTNVHPSYGTLEDFKVFIDAAHKRGIQVLIELVMNHTSDQHPWFQRARQAPEGSPEREFYVWSKDNTRFPGVPIIFKDTEKSNWSWDEVAQEYYWHRFFSHQPDLNFDNPVVVEEMQNIMRFWLGLGVDGLRLDAIPYLVERDGTRCESLPETHAIIKHFRKVMDDEFSNRFFLAEANQWPSDVRPYFGDGDECNMAFHFPLMPRIYVALRQEDTTPIIDIMRQTPELPPSCQWGLFLRNHDELTLEMVTEDERDYMYFAYSADPRTRINLGIRRRLAPLLDNNRLRIELLTGLLFSFPGTPILYYGDEIGMGDNMDLGDRNGVRTPMQWSAAPNGGFSTADPAQIGNPVISDPVFGFQAVNVDEQTENPSSLLQWMQNMIGLRKLFPVFGRGTLRFLTPTNHKVLAYLRQLGEETVLCVANLSRFAQPVTLDLDEFRGATPVEMIGYTPFPPIEDSPYSLTLSPYASLWFELQAQPKEKPTALNAGGTADEQEQAALAQAAVLATGQPAVIAEAQDAPGLLVHLSPTSYEALQNSVHLLTQEMQQATPLPWRITLAFPLLPGDDALKTSAATAQMVPPGLEATLKLAPYSTNAGALPPVWPHSVHTYMQMCTLMEENKASVGMLLDADEGMLHATDWSALAEAVVRRQCDLAVPRYKMNRYEALLNTGVLYPLMRALYGGDVRFPLAANVAFSADFCKRVNALALEQNRSMLNFYAGIEESVDERILWPATETIMNNGRIAQVQVGRRHLVQAPPTALAQLFSRVIQSMFVEVERNALFWQKAMTSPNVMNIPRHATALAGGPPDATHAANAQEAAEEAATLQNSFRLGAAELQEIWAHAMSPGTLLALKRLAEKPAESFVMPEKLWARIVYEFLAAYRRRSVNRNHLSGALVPLYYGWAASYVMQVSSLTDEQAEEKTAALAAAYQSDKQHLISLWRWPDRFTP